DRVRRRAGPLLPRGDRGLRGVERRRRRRLGPRRPPHGRVAGRGHRCCRPGGVLRLPGQPAAHRHRPQRSPPAHLAHDPHRRRSAGQPRPRRDPGQGHRAEHALAPVLRRAPGRVRRPGSRARHHARCAARRQPAHPADPGHRDRLGARAGRPPAHRAVELRGPHRHRRGLQRRLLPARHPGGLLLGRGAPLRRAAPVPEGDPRPAGAARGAARRAHAARRPPRGLPRLGARGRRARERGRGHRRLRPRAGGDPRHRRAPRGQRRGDRAGVRALPQAPRPGL
ncbi:MAG: PFIG00823557: AC2 (Proteasome assembly chaperone) family, partial [uncultured Nocardioides sp.]